MKYKKLAALSLLLLSTMPMYSQVGDPRNDFAIGFNSGYTMNQIAFDPTINQNWKGEVTAGITLRYTCEKYFKSVCSIQMEFNYAKLGWKELIETTNDTYERDINYIQIPILARMGWGYEERGVMFYVVAGPQIGYCIGEKSHKGGLFNDSTLQLRPNGIRKQYDMKVENKFDYGITAGIGLEVNTKIGHFMVEGRYYYALSDIYGNGKKDFFGRSANGMIAIKATYLIDIFKTKK